MRRNRYELLRYWLVSFDKSLVSYYLINMKTTWLNKKANLKKEDISNWVESLTENDARLLSMLCDEVRERAMMELAEKIDQSNFMRTFNRNSFKLIQAPSFRLV